MKITRDLAIEAISGLYEGVPLKATLLRIGVNRSEFYRIVESDPILSDMITRARSALADLSVEEMRDIADNESDAAKARNMIDVRKWTAAKLRPQVYGDRLDLNVTNTVDLGTALTDASLRYSNATQLPVIETEGHEIIEENKQLTTGLEPVAPPEVDPLS